MPIQIARRLLKPFTDDQEMIAHIEELFYAGRNIRDFGTDWMELNRNILRVERMFQYEHRWSCFCRKAEGCHTNDVTRLRKRQDIASAFNIDDITVS